MGSRRTTVEDQIKRAEEICDRRGAQLTELRRSVLSLILSSAKPETAYQLLDRLKEMHKGAVPPTIYRALDFLMAQKLIHKIERLNAFIPCTDTGHPHSVQFLICRECGTVTEIEDRSAVRAVAAAAEREGFHPSETIVEIEGTCAACFRSA
jgi:Fur family transcriptional regulator, zinc uptake regulator